MFAVAATPWIFQAQRQEQDPTYDPHSPEGMLERFPHLRKGRRMPHVANTGLVNTGDKLCGLNSLLQGLSTCRSFVGAVFDEAPAMPAGDAENATDGAAPAHGVAELAKLLAQMRLAEPAGLITTDVRQGLGLGSWPWGAAGAPLDALAQVLFGKHILGALEAGRRPLSACSEVRKTETCAQCGTVREESVNAVLVLKVDLVDKGETLSSLEEALARHAVNAGTQMINLHCHCCNTYSPFESCHTLLKAPQLLLVQLGIESMDGRGMHVHPVRFPLEALQYGGHSYTLQGVVLFDGRHYTALTREAGGAWALHDDAATHDGTALMGGLGHEQRQQLPYLFFYERHPVPQDPP